MNKLAVIIGRFQTPYLHKGHIKLIEEAKSISNDILILIGCTAAVGTDKNPLDYKTRALMFYEAGVLSNPIIQPLHDVPSDKDWSDQIDEWVRVLGYKEAIILGGRDNSIQGSYSGKHEVKIIEAYGDHAASTLRKKVAKEPLHCPEFRSGIIYHVENRYPIVYSTVDVALINKEGRYLMGKKGDKFMFIGGFVDVNDKSLLDAALRELKEETGIRPKEEAWSKTILKYVISIKINDSRYKNTKDSIITHLFTARFDALPEDKKIIDKEFTEFKYLDKGDINLVSDVHKELFQILTLKYY